MAIWVHRNSLGVGKPSSCPSLCLGSVFPMCTATGLWQGFGARDKAQELLVQEQLKSLSWDSSAPAGAQGEGRACRASLYCSLPALGGEVCVFTVGWWWPSQMPLPSHKRRTGRCETSSLRQLLLLTRGWGDLGGITSAAKSRKVH